MNKEALPPQLKPAYRWLLSVAALALATALLTADFVMLFTAVVL